MNNMDLYNKLRAVPDEAKKAITAGRLKGMSDINPMWRIKALTEAFGPCGVGWWYEVTNKHIEYDEITNQKAAFVDILLFFTDPESGETSHGIPGTGGASFVVQETNRPYLSDECYKMALTDAISVAAKALGVAADVYFAKDRTKYSDVKEPEQEKPKENKTKTNEEKPVEKTQKDNDEKPVEVLCPICNKPVRRTKSKGVTYEPLDILKRLGGMCPYCYKKMNDESSNS